MPQTGMVRQISCNGPVMTTELEQLRQAITERMMAAHQTEAAIAAFLASVDKARQGDTGLIAESDIDPVESLTRMEDLEGQAEVGHDLLDRTAIVKLNGGLGTSMGLNAPKSLISVKNNDNFLDLIAKQVLRLRDASGHPLHFYLMNSYATQQASLEHLARYSELDLGDGIDFVQSQVPRLDAQTLQPVSWPKEPRLQWCPPGHGDLYAALLGSGVLERLKNNGVKYVFVSNADNLGATLDLELLGWFAASGLTMAMEVTRRTDVDRKGGHLAIRRSDGRLILRERAQCAQQDRKAFSDIKRHRFFNTNNLWLHLDGLAEILKTGRSWIDLPLIVNQKTVDPRDPQSPAVVQLETAMGSAIEAFSDSAAIEVPRTRFAPVKSTSDLLALRSDAFVVSRDFHIELDPRRQLQPPRVKLSAEHKMLEPFEQAFPHAPSLLEADKLRVDGPIGFAPGVTIRGKVRFESDHPATVVSGIYQDQKVTL
ncbi:MAG: UTP--glucose-1-phosphate uridylyltransferase [Lysobacteraceae bacterium]|nr:MAG: UTP--glucose-1-phosphate uridylyltransferase [Xanthomonadaceae bacterium]